MELGRGEAIDAPSWSFIGIPLSLSDSSFRRLEQAGAACGCFCINT